MVCLPDVPSMSFGTASDVSRRVYLLPNGSYLRKMLPESVETTMKSPTQAMSMIAASVVEANVLSLVVMEPSAFTTPSHLTVLLPTMLIKCFAPVEVWCSAAGRSPSAIVPALTHLPIAAKAFPS